jgi:hypothetical protein
MQLAAKFGSILTDEGGQSSGKLGMRHRDRRDTLVDQDVPQVLRITPVVWGMMLPFASRGRDGVVAIWQRTSRLSQGPGGDVPRREARGSIPEGTVGLRIAAYALREVGLVLRLHVLSPDDWARPAWMGEK